MFLLFALCLLFFSVGYIFLYEHGLGAPEQDLTLDIILTIMNTGYVGNIVLALICITALFCSLLGGLYGRARVFQVTLPKTIPVFVMTRRRYIGIVLCLVLSAISSHYFWTMEYVRDFIAIRLVFFTALIGILMIVDSRLSPGFRGSLLWYGIMAAGGLYSFILGLTLISCYLS
jgi:general stress protein CsbA